MFRILFTALTASFLWCATSASADQVQLLNGDRLSGNVVSINSNTVVLESQALGKLTLSRSTVATISLGAAAVTAPAPPNINTDLSSALRHLGAATNAIAQIRKQFLDGAGPEATQKFDDLMTGLASGNIDLNGLRAQAKDAADKLHALKKDIGGEAGETLDAYLSILDSFLAQTSGNAAPGTNSTAAGH